MLEIIIITIYPESELERAIKITYFYRWKAQGSEWGIFISPQSTLVVELNHTQDS